MSHTSFPWTLDRGLRESQRCHRASLLWTQDYSPRSSPCHFRFQSCGSLLVTSSPSTSPTSTQMPEWCFQSTNLKSPNASCSKQSPSKPNPASCLDWPLSLFQEPLGIAVPGILSAQLFLKTMDFCLLSNTNSISWLGCQTFIHPSSHSSNVTAPRKPSHLPQRGDLGLWTNCH